MHQQRHFSLFFSTFHYFNLHFACYSQSKTLMVITIKINFYCPMIQALKSLCFMFYVLYECWILNGKWYLKWETKKCINFLQCFKFESIVIMVFKLFFRHFNEWWQNEENEKLIIRSFLIDDAYFVKSFQEWLHVSHT